MAGGGGSASAETITVRLAIGRLQPLNVSVRGKAFPLSGAGAPHAEMATLRCSARGRAGRVVRRARSPLSSRVLGRYCGRRRKRR